MKAEENLIIMDSYQNGMTINCHVDIDNDRDEEVAKFSIGNKTISLNPHPQGYPSAPYNFTPERLE